MTSPVPPPITPFKGDLTEYFAREIRAINQKDGAYDTSCSKCLATTEVLHLAAITQSVDTFTALLIDYCEAVDLSIYAVTCHAEYSPTPHNQSTYSSDAGGTGPYWAQLYAKLNSETGDMQALCSYNFGTCSAPPVILIDESQYFSPKPAHASEVPTPSGNSIQVLHLSDTHLDVRYDIGSEANCSQYLCCRPFATNTDLHTTDHNPSIPASRYGSLYCDSPPDLFLSTFTTMDQFFKRDEVAFAIFTGDTISHDNDDQISRAYVEYEEKATYKTFKAQLGGMPLYATLGNHDSLPEAYNTPNNIYDDTGHQGDNAFSWNYELLSSLWQQSGWITAAEAQQASTHYGAYAHTTSQGLRIISINTDFWYVDNIFNYFNFTNPDQSGVLKFLADELSACESRGQRAWVIGHVPSGYDGSNALPNPSALFYSIVRRFSPATIAAVFFGHTHEDQLQIFYDYKTSSLSNETLRNTTDVDYSKPLQIGFIGPSVTPLTGNNAGYQLLQVDSKTFSVLGQKTYFANVSDSLHWDTPIWKFEYDTRKTYNVGGIKWPATSPLNATFFDKVADEMLNNQSLVETYNFLETKSSPTTKKCTSPACTRQKVCYIKSGSASLGLACGSNNGPY